MKLQRYADKFLLVSTYAEMSEEERKRNTSDETPIETLAVDEEFLTQYAKSLGYGSLDRFLHGFPSLSVLFSVSFASHIL